MSKNKYLVLSVVLSVVFVAAITYGATTISTNINTGGTLTVSGASTLTGNVTMSGSATVNGNATLGDVATDVILSTGQLQASSTTLLGETLVLKNSTSATTAVEGGIYYDSSSKVIRMYDGSAWYTVGTTTGGLTLSGNRVQLSNLNYYMTFGTTTQQGLSMMTLEATSTAAIPLTIVARSSQTSDNFRILDSGSNELFAIDAYGHASGTSLTLSDNLWVNGFATTTSANGNIATQGTLTVTAAATFNGNVTLGNEASDTVTITGNASTTNSFTVGDLASTSRMVIGGNGSTMSGLIFGYCTIPNTTIAASTTDYAACTGATGIRNADRVMVMATSSLPVVFHIGAASSTANNTISVRLYNTGETASTTTGVNSFNFIGIR